MNTANKLTLLRVVLVPVFMALLLQGGNICRYAALAVFVIASITDWLDGYIARKYNQITTFGKFVDPLADKMLTTAAFVIFLNFGLMSPWALMIVLAREFMIAGIRLIAAGEGSVIAASMWGKVKTVSQMIAIIATILIMGNELFLGVSSLLIIDVLIWISVAFAVISGAEYLIKNRKVISFK